jgi:REP element-mobilizing transposase RayT
MRAYGSFFFFFTCLYKIIKKEIRTSNFRFIKCSSQPIKLLLGDSMCAYLESEKQNQKKKKKKKRQQKYFFPCVGYVLYKRVTRDWGICLVYKEASPSMAWRQLAEDSAS